MYSKCFKNPTTKINNNSLGTTHSNHSESFSLQCENLFEENIGSSTGRGQAHEGGLHTLRARVVNLPTLKPDLSTGHIKYLQYS